ncbi:MAG: circadian clock protein KaiA [Cyanobacteria bacterium P01_A01_bin.135]
MASKVPKSKIAVYAQMSESLATSLTSSLRDDALQIEIFSSPKALLEGIAAHRDSIDCLVLEVDDSLGQVLTQLRSRSIVLPTVLVKQDSANQSGGSGGSNLLDHPALFWLESGQIDQLPTVIEAVIGQFLKITVDQAPSEPDLDASEGTRVWIAGQQRRLAAKLRERLGYLGVYYKRDPKSFLRNLPEGQKKRFLGELRQSYQDIILNYFTDDPQLNQRIDNYINSAFFADVPVVQIVEIHMEMMDAFSKQLKLEGRSDEVLLDYRLTLIDAISNLCEMYRRSIPREP